MEDDEDSFLYGNSVQNIPPPAQKEPVPDLSQIDFEDDFDDDPPKSNGVPDHSSASAELEAGSLPKVEEETPKYETPIQEEVKEVEEEEEGEEEEDSDDDIEVIMEPVVRSLDFRQRGGHRPAQGRTSSSFQAPPNNLTTEYTPRERGAPPDSFKTPSFSPSKPSITQPKTPAPTISAQPSSAEQPDDSGVDPSTLPPARAPPSHPALDPTVPGAVDGRSVFDIDMTNLADKAWRRPGSDLADWFNYGFDELSWEAYCYRRRDIGDAADAYKTSVLNFAGLQEDQLLALPPEVRTMVMTGTNAMMNVPAGGPNVVGVVGGGGGGPQGMIPPGVAMNAMGGMNPMMADMAQMGGMGPMGMGPMGMGMNGDMGVGMPGAPGMGGMMPEGAHPLSNQVTGQNMNNMHADATSDMQDAQMQGMNMDGSGLQEGNGMLQQHQQLMFNDGGATPTPQGMGRGASASQFRGRAGAAITPRGRGGFVGRGRGIPTAPARAASPLPPNVPTGPRNPGNRYKDRDTNTPDVGGLDYGGNKEGGGNSERESEERSSRKRRSPPTVEDDRIGRSSKRR